MPRVSDNLRNAQALAEFSNLEPEQGAVEYFRHNYPDFAPKGWWDERVPLKASLELLSRLEHRLLDKLTAQVTSKTKPIIESELEQEVRQKLKAIDAELAATRIHQWQVTQAYLRTWWGSHFKDDITSLTRLLGSIFNPDPNARWRAVAAWMHRQASKDLPNEKVEITGIPRITNLREDYIPIQGAIVYLFQNAWRARFCAECDKRFVAGEPKNKFCSETCSNENRLRQKREWFRKHGKQWRRKVKREKAKVAR